MYKLLTILVIKFEQFLFTLCLCVWKLLDKSQIVQVMTRSRRLILVCTICSCLSVSIIKTNTAFLSLKVNAIISIRNLTTLVLLNPDIPCLANSVDQDQLLEKLTDLDLHCLSFSLWIYINNLEKVIWLAENWKCAWHLNLFSMTRDIAPWHNPI